MAVPVLSGWSGERELCLGWFGGGWFGYCRFAAVRESERSGLGPFDLPRFWPPLELSLQPCNLHCCWAFYYFRAHRHHLLFTDKEDSPLNHLYRYGQQVRGADRGLSFRHYISCLMCFISFGYRQSRMTATSPLSRAISRSAPLRRG